MKQGNVASLLLEEWIALYSPHFREFFDNNTTFFDEWGAYSHRNDHENKLRLIEQHLYQQ